MRTSIRTAGATLAAALLATACTAAPGEPGAGRTAPVELGDVRLVAYSGCDDLLAGLRAATAEHVGPWGLGGPVTYALAEDSAARSAKQEAPEHSTTNTHEAGVDEPDLVKTDGKRVITVNRGVLRVVDAATRKVTGTLRLVDAEQAWAPADLLVSGDRALVLFSGGGIIPYGAMAKIAPSPGPRYVLVDLSGEPKAIGSITPNGSHVDARMVGSTVRLVVRSQPVLTFPDAGPDATDAERTRRNVEAVKAAPVEAWLPTYEVAGAAGRSEKRTVDCGRVSHPRAYTGTSMLTVHSLDLAGGERALAETAPIGVAADGDTVYGTGSSLYVTSNPRSWWARPIDNVIVEEEPEPRPRSTRVEQEPTPLPGSATPSPAPPGGVAPEVEPTPAEETVTVPPRTETSAPATPPAAPRTTAPAPETTPAAPEETARPAEPEGTPAPETTPVLPPEETEIHRFDVTAPGAPRYAASGRVPGRLLNQYSLSEHEGHLRVATTLETGKTSSSTVYALKADTLAEVGRVGGLGEGERIYSVRFIGPTGYVVTFRQVDPLYVLDLRDPAAPRKTGELKITGYSAYLHPAGDGRLIGIGQEASERGRTLGTQVSLFDVRDPANPRRLAQFFQKDSGSEAEWDPHAFLYWAPTGTAVLPLSTWTGTEQTNGAALVLTVGDAAVTRAGTVVHPAPKPVENTRIAPYDPGIRRSVVIGDALWTVSDLGLAVNALDGLAKRAWIPFD
ncbi:beta-propeller domain-containing protein [Planomonospora sp. ID82291]|uniref:beta-propeller domain-containing protein n=1 Tax=Planomonospora sp. ID82291 TaxID=2738136 RepID=UPI0018C37FFB|nr:beta-propeller domain-containing protein [Planomonospora sp. ID82291]MBG0813567.1 beta-propeller domain-containing protein [Planomonospora sp. ID82291]